MVHSTTTGKLSSSQLEYLSKGVTIEEIKDVIKNMNPMKAPESNGFTGLYFKFCLPIIGEEANLAIKDYFRCGKLLKQVDDTFIALIPKVENLELPEH